MPYVCKFCKGRYCAAHRLPENHGCQGLDQYRERVRREGRPFAAEPGTPLQPQVAPTARAGAALERTWARLDGRVTYVLLGVILAVFLLEQAVLQLAPDLFGTLFVIDRGVLFEPWTLVTSTLAHDPQGIGHIFGNGIGLFFFGMAVERLIGSKRFTLLFFGAGAIAGLAQVLLFPGGALGASGGLLGIIGLLVVIAPRLTVYIMGVVPAPMWALGAVYVLLDLFGAFNPSSGVGHVAHLAGFAIGAAYGWHLRQKGLRVMPRQREPTLRRYF